MTNPVILLGTQSNGETLPVQVDATGRLVAEGLQGPPGPEGPQGPEGPSGGMELPPDPYEGAFLGWLNGELAWIGTPPVPIPEGVFGPITAWDPVNTLVTIEGTAPENIENGVYLTQCDEQGFSTNPSKPWNIRQNWSSLVDGYTSYQGSWENASGFDGNPDTKSLSSTNFNMTELGLEVVTNVVIYLFSGSSEAWTYSASANGGAQSSITGTSSSLLTNPIVLPVNGPLESLQFDLNGNPHGGIYKILIDGLELVDENIGRVEGRVNQRITDNVLLVVPMGDPFVAGQYLRSPNQRVAPWVLYGNDPTSLIDHLRQS